MSYVRLIIDGDDLYVNQDVTYKSNLLSYINTIINTDYNGQHPKIDLEIHYENTILLVNISTPEERSKAQKDIK